MQVAHGICVLHALVKEKKNDISMTERLSQQNGCLSTTKSCFLLVKSLKLHLPETYKAYSAFVHQIKQE